MPDGEELEQMLFENLKLLGFEKQNETNTNKTEQNTTKGGDSE